MKVTLLAAMVSCLVTFAVVFSSKAFAQAKPAVTTDWSKIQVVTYASGLTGFFDPNSGKLYIYDSNWDKCFCIRQLTQLGEPMQKLKN